MRRNYEQIKGPQLVAQCLNWDIAAELDGVADAELLYSTAQLLIRLAADQNRAYRMTSLSEEVQELPATVPDSCEDR